MIPFGELLSRYTVGEVNPDSLSTIHFSIAFEFLRIYVYYLSMCKFVPENFGK